jgi:hypothetical protein
MPEFSRSIEDEIRYARLVGDDGPADLNWRQVSEILAEQLDALAARLADAPDNTDADDERVARAAVALRQYRAACTETDDLT